MYKRLLQNALIDQEKRASRLCLALLLTVIFAVDILLSFFLSATHRPLTMIAYAPLFLFLPLWLYFIKSGSPHIVKYLLFITYAVSSLVMETTLFWGSEDYTGGNVAEVYFLLFSPIFINKRYFYLVTAGISLKYVLIGLLLKTDVVLLPLALILVLSLVSFVILNRFFGYINAMNDSYYSKFEGVVKGIVSTLELKDPYTRGHSQRVAEYSVILAGALDLYREDDLKLIYYACLLHDVGKVHTPDHILTKPGKLTSEEYEIVKQHPIYGANAIRDIEGLEFCLDIIAHHHERWDGKGYPDRLTGTKIPITARITAIADSFDAMTTQRSYRHAMTAEEAYKQIVEGAGSQFDPALVDYFKRIYPEWKAISERGGSMKQPEEAAATTT